MRRRRPIEEPLSIDDKVIADTLTDLGFVQMAAFVRHLADVAQQANLRERDLGTKINELAKRLHQYEPPPPPLPPRRTSEWE